MRRRAIRCQAVSKDGAHCRCSIQYELGAICDHIGQIALVLCDTHKKVLTRGGAVRDRYGGKWKAVLYDEGRYYVQREDRDVA